MSRSPLRPAASPHTNKSPARAHTAAAASSPVKAFARKNLRSFSSGAAARASACSRPAPLLCATRLTRSARCCRRSRSITWVTRSAKPRSVSSQKPAARSPLPLSQCGSARTKHRPPSAAFAPKQRRSIHRRKRSARFGGEWPDKARAAARSIEGAGSEEPDADHIEGIRLLADIKTVFNRRKGLNGKPVEALSAADIIAEICNLEENPWADYKFGRRLSEMAFGQLLKDFEIKSRKVPSGPDKDRKRWYRADFDDAWQRYPPQNSESGGSTPFSASAASSGLKNKGNSAFKASSQEEAQNGKNPNDFNGTESAEAQDPPDGDDLSFSDGLGENGSKPPPQPSGDDDDELWEFDDL